MQNPYFSLLCTAWKYARDEKKRFILIYSLFIMANMVIALNPLFYGWFIGDIQKKGAAVLDAAWIYAGGFLLLRLIEWSFHGPARVMERQLAFRVARNFMDDIYHKVLHLPLDWHQENHSGSTINKLKKAHEALRDFFQQGFIYFYSLWKFIFSFGAMLYFSPLFGGVGVALGAVTVLIIIRFDKPFIKSLREVHRKEHEVSSTLFDSLSNIRTVITLKLEQRIQGALLDRIRAVFPPFKKNVIINEWKWFTAQMMVGLIYGVTVLGYIYQHWIPGEAFQIAGLIVLIGYVNQFTSVFNDIAAQYTQIVRFHTEVRNAGELEAAYTGETRSAAETPLRPDWRQIGIRQLSFSRKETSSGDHSGLTNVNIDIRRGQRVAVIGESGSGKSTLLSLLRGLHQPKAGTLVTVDGSVNYELAHVCASVTLFPQEPEIFENSILYNITLGLPFTEEEVMRVCEDAHFGDVIRKLPHGLHSHIQEKGVNLSGGQKQRLALARGILAARQSDIILLDEPTSSVDPRTEKMIYSNLFGSFQNKAVISSLHRLHLLHDFDYIYIMQHGIVIDQGTFEDLKRYSLVFKEMWEHQRSETPREDYPAMNVAL